jgi:hypothetical protein
MAPVDWVPRQAVPLMRCPTCSDTLHPGFIALREVEVRDGVRWRDLRPCPDCGGSTVASCCDGTVGRWQDTPNRPQDLPASGMQLRP